MPQRRRQSVRERPEWQCQYRGGECTNARATKIDGSLHHLCQDHRLRANWNQRRCQQRQREQQRQRQRQRPNPRGTQPREVDEGTPTARRRQVARDDQLRRLDYAEWLQILDSLDWQDTIDEVSSFEGLATPAVSENELFAPIVAQLAIHPSLQDPSLGDDIFYLIGSDINSYIPSISGEETVPDNSDSG